MTSHITFEQRALREWTALRTHHSTNAARALKPGSVECIAHLVEDDQGRVAVHFVGGPRACYPDLTTAQRALLVD